MALCPGLPYQIYPCVTHAQENDFVKELRDEMEEFVLIMDNASAHARINALHFGERQIVKKLPPYIG